MIPQNFSHYNSHGFPRPDDFVDPKTKQNSPKWCHMYAQFIFSQYMNGSSAVTLSMRDKIETNILYAEGNQPTEKYKKRFLDEAGSSPTTQQAGSDIDSGSSLKAKNEGYANMNFDEVFSPLPKYVNNIIGIMQNQDHDIKIDAVDENSGSTRDNIKFSLYAKKELFEEIQLFNKAFGLEDGSQDVPLPQNIQELEMFAEMGMFKLPYEIGMKKANNHTDNISKLRLLKEDIVYDLICHNMVFTETYVDTNGYVKHEHVSLFDGIIEQSKKKDHSDSSYCARIKWLTAADLKEETGWEDEKIREIVSKYAGSYGNPTYDPARIDERSFSFSSYRIPVLRCYWKSVDSIYETDRQKGNRSVTYQEDWKGKKPRFYNNDNRKTNRTDVHTQYHCCWVIDFDETFVYEYGRPHNLPYNYETKEVELNIHFYKGRGRSIIDMMRIIEDDIMFTYLKLQNNIIQAPPPGIAFDVGSLDNLTLDGTNKLTPKDSIQLYSDTGNFLYRLAPGSLSIGGSNHKPIEELRGGLGTAITDAVAALELFYRQLDVITGIDPITSSNQAPSPDQGKAVTEMAVSSTTNTLKLIYSGYLTMKEAQTKTATYFIQALTYLYRDSIEANPYFKVIGKTNLMAIITAGEYPPVCYGFSAKAVPSDSITAEVRNTAREALHSGRNGVPVITYSEYLFIVEHLDTYDGVGWARIFIARKEQQRAQEESQKIKANEEAAIKSAESAKAAETKSKLEIINAEKEADKEIKTHETSEAIKLDNAKTENIIRVKKETGDVVIEK